MHGKYNYSYRYYYNVCMNLLSYYVYVHMCIVREYSIIMQNNSISKHIYIKLIH